VEWSKKYSGKGSCTLAKFVGKHISDIAIDIESLQNRLLKVCYVPAISASLPRVSFFFFFLFFVAAAIDSTNEENKVT
jgi:hypothetical protein